MSSAVEVIRHAQKLLYQKDDQERNDVMDELDVIANALGVLPNLHEQERRRYAVLFPDEIKESS